MGKKKESKGHVKKDDLCLTTKTGGVPRLEDSKEPFQDSWNREALEVLPTVISHGLNSPILVKKKLKHIVEKQPVAKDFASRKCPIYYSAHWNMQSTPTENDILLKPLLNVTERTRI